MNVAKYTRVPWACLVFVGCLAYFLLSGAWVPYPGASADFLAAICFPGQLEGDVLEPLGTALTWLAHTLGGWAGVTFLSAALGAWTVTMLFVAARVSSLALLPQGRPEAARRAKAMVAKMDELGFGACTNTQACQSECPKGITVSHIARLNREFLCAKLKD